MSRWVWTIAMGLVGMHGTAFANNIVCAGTKIYFRYLQADSGIKQMPATWSILATPDTGKEIRYTVSTDAKAKYEVETTDVNLLLDKSSGTSLDQIYEAQVTIKNLKGTALVTDLVRCSHTQGFMP